MSNKQLFTDQRLAEILYEASTGRNYITSSEYTKWYNATGATPMDCPKNLQTIFDRLGEGRAAAAFKRMRELLGVEECSNIKIINLLGEDLRLGFIARRKGTVGLTVIPAATNFGRAVLEEVHLTSGCDNNESFTAYELKLCCDEKLEPENIIDFPEQSPGVFYLIRAELYRKLSISKKRLDLIPVHYITPSHRLPVQPGLYILSLS